MIAKSKTSQINQQQQQQQPQHRGYISNQIIERANEIDYENKLRDQQVKIIKINMIKNINFIENEKFKGYAR